MRRLLLLTALALALGGCGGSTSESDQGSSALPATASEAAAVTSSSPPPAERSPEPGASTARIQDPPGSVEPTEAGVTIWVTRAAGAELLRDEQVKPGLTAIQAVALAADVETRYGGRFVSSIDGISSDLDGQEDWFFLINGIEPDVGAAEIKVGAGDVVWWDYRSWIDSAAHPAVAVGAFPRPFHRGWKGVVRPVEVVAPTALAEVSGELESFLATSTPDDADAEPHRFALELRPDLEGAELSASMGSKNGSAVTFVLSGSELAINAAARALIANPQLIARRYTASFDATGRVIDR